ncbi:hypothetical protein GCM10025868_20820 [Angustibacter aerolatus]|uniref:EAL domain-containing protein n=1 Tax=Angustibacter aerolatus TaxID=1162965 RepID=A0ABQ6JF49_9ACTN|nr:hypothetical protein GCM10025868_20820 [Angustibacter aerolatus]
MLRRMPFDVLKIDRSFVSHVHDQARDTVIIRLVIDTAHSLGLHVCAEGVEGPEQAQQLLALGCDWAQGYWFGRPQREADLDRPAARLDPQVPPPVRIWGSNDEPGGHHRHHAPHHLRLAVVAGGARLLAVAGSSGGRWPTRSTPTTCTTCRTATTRRSGGRRPAGCCGCAAATASTAGSGSVAQAVKGPDGVATEIVSISRDVTRQIEVERRLAGTEARFEWAFEQAPIGMALSRFDGTIVQVNEAFARLLGTTPDELVGRSVADLTHPDDRAADERNLQRLLAGEPGSQRVEKRYLDVHGEPVHALVLAGRLDDDEGRPTMVTAHILPSVTPVAP